MKVYCEVLNCNKDGKTKFLEDNTHKILVLRVQGGGEQTDRSIIKKSEPFETSDSMIKIIHFHGFTWNYDPSENRIYITNCPIQI